MEDKLHNDRLEEFLRRSLEEHSEDPPKDLWAKIANGVDAATPSAPPTVKAPRWRVLSNWWAAAAVAAAVIGLFIAQHSYFENRIDELTKELEQKAAQSEKMETKAPVPTEKAETEVPAIANETETANGSSSKAAENALAKNRNDKSTTPAHFGVTKQGKRIQGNNNKFHKSADPTAPLKSALAAETSTDKALPTSMDKVEPSNREAQKPAVVENSDLQKVWLKPIKLEDAATEPSLAQAVMPIDPVKNHSKFTLGLNAMPMLSRSWMKPLEQKGPGKPNDRKSFDVDSETTGQAWQAGITLEAAITPRLSVGSGLGYRSMKYETKHDLCLEFDDRRPGPPGTGQHDHEHDFQYDLNTAVGAIEMEVRAESDEATQNIPDDEKIEAEVHTSQSLSYVTVPIYANYTMGKGRLRAIAKGGIMLNFLQDHEFTVGDIKSLNDKFQFAHKENQRGTQNDLQTVTVDYMAGLGLEYRLTRNASLRLEPMVIGSLTSLHNNPRIESTEIAAGLNLGMTYSF